MGWAVNLSLFCLAFVGLFCYGVLAGMYLLEDAHAHGHIDAFRGLLPTLNACGSRGLLLAQVLYFLGRLSFNSSLKYQCFRRLADLWLYQTLPNIDHFLLDNGSRRHFPAVDSGLPTWSRW